MDVWGLIPEELLLDWLLLSVVVMVGGGGGGGDCFIFPPRKPGKAPPSNVMSVAL
jgi:hypothetical protein